MLQTKTKNHESFTIILPPQKRLYNLQIQYK